MIFNTLRCVGKRVFASIDFILGLLLTLMVLSYGALLEMKINIGFLLASFLLVILSFLHSYLGEKLILKRLFLMEVPKILGSQEFTKNILRMAWHLTSIAWLGIAIVLVMPAHLHGRLYAFMFLISAVYSLYQCRAKHFSWWVFALISSALFYAAYF